MLATLHIGGPLLSVSKPIPSNSLEAAIRAHFGLTQEELARYLGITRGQVAHLEAGRRLPSTSSTMLIWPLALLLPPPEGQGEAAPDFLAESLAPCPGTGLLLLPPNVGPLLPTPLRVRQRRVAAQAAALRWALHKEAKRHALQSRRQWGLAVLQANLPQLFTLPDKTKIQRWLDTLSRDVAATIPAPAATTAQILMVLRMMALEAEAAALGQLLDGVAKKS